MSKNLGYAEPQNKTIDDLAKNKKESYIILIEDHYTTLVNGKLIDSFFIDYSERVICYWKYYNN